MSEIERNASPPPLRGRSDREAIREGGHLYTAAQANTPLPNPPPQGGRGHPKLANESVDAGATLRERASAAARAELRGDRESILGAIGIASAAPLMRARQVPDRWSFLFVMERMEEGFRILSRLALPTRPRGYINSMPIYVYDQGDHVLNSTVR